MDDPSAIAQSAVPRMKRPTFAALPITTDRGPDWIGPALADDILNETVRCGQFSALSRMTTFGPEKDVAALCTLGADAVMSGRIDGTVLSLTLQQTGREPETLELTDVQIESLQLTADLATDWLLQCMGGALDLPAPVASNPREHVAPELHAASLRAFERFWTLSAEGNCDALDIMRTICDAHPSYGLAHSFRACLLTRAYRSGWIKGRDDVVAEVIPALAAARANWSNDSRMLWTTAFTEAMLLRNYPVAATLVRRAALEHPHISPLLTWGSLFLSYDLDFDGALNLARQSMRVSPEDPMRITQGFAGALAAIHGARDQEALELCDMVLAKNPKMVNVMRIRAAALVHLGKADAAREVMTRLRTIAPNETRAMTEQVNPLREWPGFSRFLVGLAGAGMP